LGDRGKSVSLIGPDEESQGEAKRSSGG